MKESKKIELMEPTATSFFGHPRNGVDGKKETYFSLQGGETDGYWQAMFTIP